LVFGALSMRMGRISFGCIGQAPVTQRRMC